MWECEFRRYAVYNQLRLTCAQLVKLNIGIIIKMFKVAVYYVTRILCITVFYVLSDWCHEISRYILTVFTLDLNIEHRSIIFTVNENIPRKENNFLLKEKYRYTFLLLDLIKKKKP